MVIVTEHTDYDQVSCGHFNRRVDERISLGSHQKILDIRENAQSPWRIFINHGEGYSTLKSLLLGIKVILISHKLKQLDRKRKRLYRKERRSVKWQALNKMFKKQVQFAKSQFFKQTVAELKLKKPGQWYSCLTKITSYDQQKKEQQNVEEISHLPDEAQAEIIAEQFASIQNEYDSINKDDIFCASF